jgi:hypothetical protein
MIDETAMDLTEPHERRRHRQAYLPSVRIGPVMEQYRKVSAAPRTGGVGVLGFLQVSRRFAGRHALKKVTVAEDTRPVGATERITVRTTTASATRPIHDESNQGHGQDDKNERRRHHYLLSRSVEASDVSLKPRSWHWT